MAWLAVDKDLGEAVFEYKPVRASDIWHLDASSDCFLDLPNGSIEKLIGYKLTWEDEPVELK